MFEFTCDRTDVLHLPGRLKLFQVLNEGRESHCKELISLDDNCTSRMNGLAKAIRGKKEQMLAEPSVSRAWRLINNPDVSFAIISASLDKLSDSENRRRHKEVKKKIRNLEYDYVELTSGYSRVGNDDDELAFTEEMSFMVPGISRADAIGLATEHNQPSILWKDGGTFVLLGTCEDVGIEKVIGRFNTESGNTTFEPESVRDAFSALSGSETECAFVAERAVRDFPTRMMYVDEKMLRGDWIVIL